MSSWAERLSAANAQWRQGDLDGATTALREIVVAGDAETGPEAAYTLGRVLQDGGDLDGAAAVHRSVLAGGHPVFAQRSAILLGMMLVDADQWALAHRPLSAAASGPDAEITLLAEITLVSVSRRLGDFGGAAAALERARRSEHPRAAELTAELETPRWPDDGGEREREAWAAYEAITALDEHEDTPGSEVVETALDRMLTHGMPELCSKAAFRLYSIHAARGEFGDCRRVMEHALAAGDPAERGRSEKLLGAALVDLGEPIEALEAYRRAAEDHRPEIRLDALIEQSKLARELGDDEECRALLRRVAETGHPRFSVEARACLGQVHAEDHEIDEAVACWRVVLDAESEFHIGAVHFLGMMLHGLADDDPRRTAIIELLHRAAELDDSDVSFQARLTLAQAETAVRGPDEEREQALDDCDTALEMVRAGDLPGARALLRRVVDAEVGDQSDRAARTLALLELGEGDAEQAEELLAFIADGADFANGFAAAVDRHLILAGEDHPVLAAFVDYQRHGREVGIARHQECAEHPDAAVAALGSSVLAQVIVSLGAPLSQGVQLIERAAGAGDPLALSHAAVLSWLLRGGDDPDTAIELLRRAAAGGHPALSAWVSLALGGALVARGREDDADEALAAYTRVRDGGHPGLLMEAHTGLLQILEGRGDLAGAAAAHERIIARADRLLAPRSAWLLGFTRVRTDDLDAARSAFDLVPEDHEELGPDGVFARRLLDRDLAGARAALAAVRERGDDHQSFMTGQLALESAHAWQRGGHLAAAEAALSLVAEDGPPELVQEAALYLGALRNDAGDEAGAAEAWDRAAAGDDAFLARRGARWLAAARRDKGDLEGAAAAFRQALDGMPTDEDGFAEVLDEAVGALAAVGRADEARVLQAAKAGDVPHPDLVVGTVLGRLGDLTGAAAYLRKAIADHPADVEAVEASGVACVELARVLARRNETAEAADHGRRAVALFERLAEIGVPYAPEQVAAASLELGDHLTALGDTGSARPCFERAAEAEEPAVQMQARERLGVATAKERALLRLGEGDRDGALALYTEEYGSSDLAGLRMSLLDADRDAVRSLLDRLRPTEHAATASTLLAETCLLWVRQDDAEAHAVFDLLVEYGRAEDVAEAAEHLTRACDLGGDFDAAITVAERGAAVDHPRAIACLRLLVSLLADGDDHDRAEEAVRRALDSGDRDAVTDGLLARAVLAERRDDLAAAAATYREAIAGAALHYMPHLHVGLGNALHGLGETEAACRVMERVLASDDHTSVMHAGARLGSWLYEDGERAGAAEAFGTAAAAGWFHPDPNQSDHDLYQWLGETLLILAREVGQDGDAAVAVRALHLLAAGGVPGEALQQAHAYAVEAAEQGDLKTARTYYKGAAEFPPDGDEASLIALARLLVEHGHQQEARALLEPLTESADTAVRATATASLLTLLRDMGQGARALAVAATAAGLPAGPDEEAADSDPDEQADPDDLDSVRGLLRDQAGTPTAGDAGRQVIHAAREIMTGEPARARQMLELVVEYGDLDEVATAHDDIGDIHRYIEDDTAAAVEAYRKGAETGGPAALLPLRSLLNALLEMEDYDGAAETAQRAVTSDDPETVAYGYWAWGDSRLYRGDADAAVRLYRQGIEVGDDDTTPRIRIDLARVLRGDGRSDLARAELRQAAAESADAGVRVQAGSMLGRLAFEEDDLETAALAFAQVSAIDVDRDEDERVAAAVEDAVTNVCVVANTATRREEHELAVFALAHAADAGHPEIAFDLCETRAAERAEAGDRAGALVYAEGALGFLRDPAPDVQVRLADLFVSAGDAARARATYERLLDHPDAEVRLVAGGRLVPLLRTVGDAAALERVTERVRGDSAATGLDDAAATGLDDAAATGLDDAAATGLDDGSQALLSSMLGIMQSDQGDDSAALRTLRGAAEGGEPIALLTLGEHLVKAGEPAEARQVLDRIPESDERLGRHAVVLIGRTYHDEDPGRAREQYLRALKLPGEPDGAAPLLAKMYLGALAKRDRDWPEALRWYQAVVDSGDGDQAPLAAAHLGELAYWLGDRDSAARFYELTLATGTTSAELVGEAAYRLGEMRLSDGHAEEAREHLLRAAGSGDDTFAEQARKLLGDSA
ncbi:tetratricopeptide repeat protein [Spirillospora sp. NPDC047279]|uniref:tetratricopeptide repeat protein n=1 Tax=Spirillospora sp. NPDC047279 TaxID=3155478 RepID=UPI0033C51C33